MNTTKTRQEILDEIEEEIRNIMYQDAKDGHNGYSYVRVNTDGSVYSGHEPSHSMTIDEWEGKAPHTVTVWSLEGFRESAGSDSDVFEWDEVDIELREGEYINNEYFIYDQDDEPVESVEDRMGFYCWNMDGQWYRLSDRLLSPFDLEDKMNEIDEMLNEYDWLPQEELA